MIKRNTLILVLAIAVVLSIFLCGCGSSQQENVSSEKSEAAVSSKISPSPTVTPTPKPTVKPSTKPTTSPSPKATTKPISATEKPSEPKVQNDYVICPKCKYVHDDGTDCPACANNYEMMKSEEYCPTCGGGYDVGGVVPWVHCRYCDDDFLGADGPYYTCSLCGRSELYPKDMDKKITHNCVNCVETGNSNQIRKCSICGKTSEDTYITKYDLCEGCYAENNPYTNYYCSSCGTQINADNEAGLCDSCTDGYFCNGCNQVKSYLVFEGVCDECQPKCVNCGVSEGGRGLIDGYCESCYAELYNGDESSDYGSSPNVWCPNCGVGFFTTGVGVDGFTCKSCEYNWLP